MPPQSHGSSRPLPSEQGTWSLGNRTWKRQEDVYNTHQRGRAQWRHSQWLHLPRFAPMQSGFVWDAVPGDLGSCFFLHHSEGEPLFKGLFQPWHQPPCCLEVRKISNKNASLKRLSWRRVTFLVRRRTESEFAATSWEIPLGSEPKPSFSPAGSRQECSKWS